MSDITFAQAERRNFLVPALVVAAVVAIAFALIYFFTPHRIADLTVTHTAILPTHTTMDSDSKLVGHDIQSEDDLYVLATVRIDDKLKLPLFINDITGTFTAADGTEITASAVQKNDLLGLYVTFPALKPLASSPLVRDTTINPGDHAEGMVILSFPVTEEQWKQRKSASVTVTFYHQGPFTVVIPKS